MVLVALGCKAAVPQDDGPGTPNELRSTANGIAPVTPSANEWAVFASHMMMTPSLDRNARDSAKAMALADSIRRAIAKYRDLRTALAAGYEPLVPDREFNERHFSRYDFHGKRITFDIANPPSLLYKKDSAERFILVGAMYAVPGDYSEAALDSLIPLSVAHWHKHINWCIPRLDHQDDWNKRVNGELVFGAFGVNDRKKCQNAGGVFKPDLAGWMVHSLVFAGTDEKSVWGGEMMGAAMQGH